MSNPHRKVPKSYRVRERAARRAEREGNDALATKLREPYLLARAAEARQLEVARAARQQEQQQRLVRKIERATQSFGQTPASSGVIQFDGKPVAYNRYNDDWVALEVGKPEFMPMTADLRKAIDEDAEHQRSKHSAP